jgi:CYTH domain-containing protein
MAVEIERKFLLAAAPPGLGTYPSEENLQGYVAIDAVAELRVRRRAGVATLTVQVGTRAHARRGGARDRRRALRVAEG